MKSVTVVYVHVPNDTPHVVLAELYVESVLKFPGGYAHRNLILSQGAMPTPVLQTLFSRLSNCSYYVHDDSGWDIGGYIAAAAQIQDDVMVCLGSSAQVRRSGWLARMMEAWEKHGPGLYGSLASFQVRPHLNTTGFWCAPEMLLRYPVKVLTKADRYEFEHGRRAFWKRLHDAGNKVKLVTWCGEYDWKAWRSPPNISCRGNQENCLTYFRINFEYDRCRQHNVQGQLNYETLCDTLMCDSEVHEPEDASLARWVDEVAWIAALLSPGGAVADPQRPRRVLLLGCARGTWVDALRQRGIDAWGADFSTGATADIPEHVRPFCRVAKASDQIEGDFDLIVCTGVKGDLGAAEAQALVAEMCGHSPQVLLFPTSADVGVGPSSGLRSEVSWVEWFERHGFFPNRQLAPSSAPPQAKHFLQGIGQPVGVSVFSCEAPNGGAAQVRLAAPLGVLERQNRMRVRWCTAGDPQIDLDGLLAGDLFVVQREFCARGSDRIVAAARELNKPIVFELDDLLIDVPKSNPHYSQYTAITPAVLALLGEADYVTVTTEPLKHYLEEAQGQARGKIHVLPNYIDLALWDGAPLPAKQPPDPFVIGWVGAPTHDEDLAVIKPAIAKLARKHAGRLVFKFWGGLPKALEGLSGVQLVRGVEPDLRRHAREMVNSRMDLALAPLLDRPFNRAKSDIKWLEYSICYVPGIFSALSPYIGSVEHGRTGWLVDNDPEAWVEAIERLMGDHELRRTIAIQAHDEVRRTRSAEIGAERWDALYRSFQVSGRRPRSAAARTVATPHDRAAAQMMLYQVDEALAQGQTDYATKLCDQSVYRYVSEDPMGKFVRSALHHYRAGVRDLQTHAQLTTQLSVARAVAEAGVESRAIQLYMDTVLALKECTNPQLVFGAIVEVTRAFLTLDRARGLKLLEVGQELARTLRLPEGLQTIEQLRVEYRQGVAPAKRSALLGKKSETAAASGVVRASAVGGEMPVISIVIPVSNNLALTRICLKALASAPTKIAHEIIVVDNASSDGTTEFLREREKTQPLQVISNSRNEGFARGCNAGAIMAKGDFVLFLNNDTEVHAEWLDALLAAAREPQVGVVGGKLLYPDGTIQHAGIEFINGLPDHRCRHGAADAPEVNQRREFDMVTGACFLMPKKLFIDLGGFDEVFRNGVEDVDLCLRARAAGYKVVYEPKAVVTHHEGKTPGRFSHVTENLTIFFMRWKGQFDERDAFRVPTPGRIQKAERSLLATAVHVYWDGSFLDFGSLSHVNRALTDRLEQRAQIVLTRPGKAAGTEPTGASAAVPPLARRTATKESGETQVTVRHQWPPDWSRPKQGALVIIQPWEFGVLPEEWVRQSAQVDEFWVPSTYVRDVYVNSGVAAHKVKVVPNGIDPEKFDPAATPLVLATRKTFKFLFVGGTIHRKGPDVLLKAYLESFTATDDVCLVIKDFGGKSFYAGQTLEAQILAARSRPDAPEILYLNEEMPPDALPGLYTACDCLVHPYRGEGFGLPILEAMACSLPVVITAGGSADDFAPDEFAYRIPAVRKSIGDSISGMKLAGQGWLLEPDVNALGERMKWIVTHRDEARAKGFTASEHVRGQWTWERAASVAEGHLHALAARQSASMPPGKTAGARKPASITLPPVAQLGQLTKAQELLHKKSPRAAWESACEAIRARPHHPEAFLLLAEIARMVGDSSGARSCAQHAQSLAPAFKPARKFLQGKFHGNAKPAWLVLPPEIENKRKKTKARLSVCVIVKNEERFLGQCLASIKEVADQIVVVDTGSTDRTVEIAREYGAEIHTFAWCDDFSAARNAALQYSKGDWVLSLDADEEVPLESHAALRQLLADEAVMGWRLPLFDVGREGEGNSYVPRLFRNAPGLFWVGRVHEQVFYSVEVRRKEWGLDNRMGDAALRHHGYTKELVRERGKVERNLRLLEQAIHEIPDDPLLLMNYGLELIRSDRLEEGLRQHWAAFELMSVPTAAVVPPETLEAFLTQYCTHLLTANRPEEVRVVLTSPLAQEGALTASMHFLLGLAHRSLAQFSEAAMQMRHCLAKRGLATLTPVNPEIRKVTPRHWLALSLWQAKDLADAEREFQVAIAEVPEAATVQIDYARFLHEQDKTADALQLLNRLTAANPALAAAWVAGGQIALSHPTLIEVAVDWTAVAIACVPEDVAVIAQRAEALLLNGQLPDALPLWASPGGAVSDRAQAARLLCEIALEARPSVWPEDQVEMVDREFVRWYWQLVEYGAEAVIVQLHDHADALALVLPKSAQLLQSVMAKLAVPEGV